VRPFLVENGFFIPSREGDNDISPLLDAMSTESMDETSENLESAEDVPFAEMPRTVIDYEDPFRILAGWAYASQYCDERPTINVWAGGCHRLQGKISPRLCGSDRKNDTWFTQISSHEEKMYLLFNHTHWGHLIQMKRRDRQDSLHGLCNSIFKRISYLLQGRHDPLWTHDELRRFWDGVTEREDGSLGYTKRNTTYRAQRLLEVLKTVDGLFLQRFLSYPEEVWDWERYDVFVLQALSILITDEFFDGTVSVEALDTQTTFYSELKGQRKKIKKVLHSDDPLAAYAAMPPTPRWVEAYLGPVWRYSIRTSGFPRLFLAGTLSQTRGSGTPPALVLLHSKRKFLRSVQEAPPEMTRTQRDLVSVALDDVISGIPDHVFTGLETKARVTVTGAACWEHSRSEGGTAQAILDIMSKYSDGRGIPIRDLDTGEITSWHTKEQFDSIGTAVFWSCLHEVLQVSPEELAEVSLTLVKEPGKARVVTKGRAALKIVLDTVSKICSYPLKKGLESSASGMGRSNHGWNLFKDMFGEELYPVIFNEDLTRRITDPYAEHVQILTFWEDVFFSSTDYQEATDRLVHQFARIAAQKWMRKCGIPPLLRGIVMAVCYRPRKIYFTGTGPLKDIGLPVEGDTRVVTLYRGVLMGDPLTKVVLHLANVAARQLGQSLTDSTIFRHFPGNGFMAAAAFHDGMWGVSA
jgi:hypothetical protein